MISLLQCLFGFIVLRDYSIVIAMGHRIPQGETISSHCKIFQTMLQSIEWNRDNLRKMSGLVEACVGSVAGSAIQLGK